MKKEYVLFTEWRVYWLIWIIGILLGITVTLFVMTVFVLLLGFIWSCYKW
jgi:hypothetical protein